jgi:hypothetical protein
MREKTVRFRGLKDEGRGDQMQTGRGHQRVLPKVEELKPRSPKEYAKLPNKNESIYNLRNLN